MERKELGAVFGHCCDAFCGLGRFSEEVNEFRKATSEHKYGTPIRSNILAIERADVIPRCRNVGVAS